MSNGISMERVDEIIDGYGCQFHHMIAIMQDIQAEYKYLSPAVLERIAEKLGVGVAKVYSVATFYENFSTNPIIWGCIFCAFAGITFANLLIFYLLSLAANFLSIKIVSQKAEECNRIPHHSS